MNQSFTSRTIIIAFSYYLVIHLYCNIKYFLHYIPKPIHFFLDILIKDQTNDRQFIKLRHPQTGDMAIFMYSENNKKLAQIRSLPLNHR